MIKSISPIEWLNSLESPRGKFETIQKQGRGEILNHGLPNNKDENWRLTNLKYLKKILSLPIASKKNISSKKSEILIPKKSSNTIRITIDPYHNSVTNNILPYGIKIIDQDNLKNVIGNSLKLFKSSNSWPASLNLATTNNILGLSCKGKDLPPIEVVIDGDKDCINSTRIILIVEENSEVEILQVITGNNNSVHSHISEIHLKKNSKLKHKFLTLGKEAEAYLLARISVEQNLHSQYSLASIQQGWHFSRFEPQVLQKQGEAETIMKGLQIAENDQHISTHSFVRFEGAKGKLEQLQKALSNNSSHSIFNGVIEVPQQAQETQASQLSKNLLLSKRARIDTKPELKIIADNVKCTHGATVSQLQEEEIFYLMSRGISKQNANKLLIKGFYDEILNSLELTESYKKLLNRIISGS